LLGVARDCESRLHNPFSLLRLAGCCGVLRPRWCQSVFGDVNARTTAYAPVHEHHVPLRLVRCRMGMPAVPPAAYYDPQATASTPASQGFRRHLLSPACGMPMALSSRFPTLANHLLPLPSIPPQRRVVPHPHHAPGSGATAHGGRHPQPTAAIIDAQSVKTVEESAGISGYDAHKRVKGRKRHLLLSIPWVCRYRSTSLPRVSMRPGRRPLPAGRASSTGATAQEDLGR
jgi:hypothetical protein